MRYTLRVEGQRRGWILAAMCGVIAVVLLDETIVGVALPTLRKDLGLTETGAEWVYASYLLALSASVAFLGRLGDIVGLRRVLIVGTLLFSAASMLAGVAQTEWWILSARAVQGVGAAAILPASMAITTRIYPVKMLGWAFARYSIAASAALIAGPFLGGLITQVVSWRLIFFINIPISAFIIWVAIARMPRLENEPSVGRHAFDGLGLALLVLGVSAITFALMQAPTWGWGHVAIVGPLVGGVGCLVGFAFAELRHENPLMDVRLFRNPTFTAANITVLVAQFSKTSIFLYGALFLINEVQLGSLAAGAFILPGLVVGAATAPLAGRLVDQKGIRLPTLLGLVLLVAAMAYMGFAVGAKSGWLLLPGILVWGVALNFVFLGALKGVQAAVPAEKTGQSGGIYSTCQWLGASLSVAVLGVMVVTQPNYETMYFVAAGVMMIALITAWALLDRAKPGAGDVPTSASAL